MVPLTCPATASTRGTPRRGQRPLETTEAPLLEALLPMFLLSLHCSEAPAPVEQQLEWQEEDQQVQVAVGAPQEVPDDQL